MPASYKIDKQHSLVTSIESGVLSNIDCKNHQRQLAADPNFNPIFSQLIDLTQVTKLALTAEDVRQLAQAKIFSDCSRRALLASSDELFGMSRMFGILRDTMGETGVRVFRSREEAMLWVGGSKK